MVLIRSRHGESSSKRRLVNPVVQASGLAMKVGPCMSTPGSPRENGFGDISGGQRRSKAEVATRQSLADAQDVRRDPRVFTGE